MAAVGAGLDIGKACGSMVLDIGGGTSDIAVLALGDIVCSTSLKVAGNRFTQLIIDYLRKERKLAIGEQMAEEVKIRIGSALPMDEPLTMEVSGLAMESGLPSSIEVNSNEIELALRASVDEIVRAVRTVMEITPPELAADIVPARFDDDRRRRPCSKTLTRVCAMNCRCLSMWRKMRCTAWSTAAASCFSSCADQRMSIEIFSRGSLFLRKKKPIARLFFHWSVDVIDTLSFAGRRLAWPFLLRIAQHAVSDALIVSFDAQLLQDLLAFRPFECLFGAVDPAAAQP